MTDILILNRKVFTDKSTIGDLSLEGNLFCNTLEDTCRRKKIPSETAIPSGRYRLKLDLSTRYKRIMPKILEVPGYQGILIHWGNYPKDTEGCILVGHYNKEWPDMVTSSRKMFDELFDKLKQKGNLEMYISVMGGFPHDS